jgi:hypothetical protein
MAGLRARAPGGRLRIGLRAHAGTRVPSLAASLGSSTGLDVRAEGASLSIALDARQVSDDRDRAADDAADTPALVRRLVELGAEIESVVMEDASLEEVYLQLLNTPTSSRVRKDPAYGERTS